MLYIRHKLKRLLEVRADLNVIDTLPGDGHVTDH